MSAPTFVEHGLVSLEDGNFPALVEGKPAPPPPSHMLDHLVRQYVLIDDQPLLHLSDPTDLELISAETGTMAMVLGAELPTCDLCRIENRSPRTARYDGPASRQRNAPWAFLCPDCFVLNAPPVLGLGRAQYLFTKVEIPTEVRDAFFRAREFWGAKGIELPSHHPFE